MLASTRSNEVNPPAILLNPIEHPHLLFPHPWGAIIANIPTNTAQKPDWGTLSYKLQPTALDRLWASEDSLVGVRFGEYTNYGLIDIDSQSVNHPNIDQSAWVRLRQAFKSVGLVDQIIIQSSGNGGLHLYLWLPEKVKSFKLAQLLWSVCHKAGFDIKSGTVETFPNAKPYTPVPSAYNAHKLPLQPKSGGLLLNEDLEPISNPWPIFCDRATNPLQDMALFRRKLIWAKQYYRKHSRHRGLATDATEWLRDIEERLKMAWTASGQSNELIRLACTKAWVFGDGNRDDAAVVEELVKLPGYKEFCGHQNDINQRVKYWFDCVQRRYWPYCRPDLRPFASGQLEQPPETLEPKSKSTKLKDDVLERLRTTVQALMGQSLPPTIGKIVQTIQTKAKELHGRGFSINTLYSYRYRAEWRILVEEAQNHIQKAFSPSIANSKTPLDDPSNSVSDSIFSKFQPMKVGSLLRISLINYWQAFFHQLVCLFDSEISPFSQLDDLTSTPIETDKYISFTNIQRFTGDPETDIRQSYQSSVEVGDIDGSFDRSLSSIDHEEGVDDKEPVIGGYLRRISCRYNGIDYPELIAKVVGRSLMSWQLVCEQGRQWRCPFNMVGDTWVVCDPSTS